MLGFKVPSHLRKLCLSKFILIPHLAQRISGNSPSEYKMSGRRTVCVGETPVLFLGKRWLGNKH